MVPNGKEILRNIEKVLPLWFLIFLISALNFVSTDTWPNEENNFTMARHFLNPEWMPDSFSLRQWPGTNFVYWTIAGFGLKFLSFGQLAFWARLINYLLYAFPIAKIFKTLNIRPIIALLILQIFFFKQTYMTGEWIWNGFEGKTLAYLFIFWSLYFLLKNKTDKTAFFAALATYCHVLVGGWYFAGIGLYLILSGRNLMQIVRPCLIYLLAALPFILYLANYLLGGQKVDSDPSADWIYVFFRNSHHLVPTLKDHFWHIEWPFVLVMFLSLGMLFQRNFYNSGHEIIAKLVVVYNLILLAGLLITYLDKEGTLLKFYVLRMSSLSLLLTFILIAIILQKVNLRRISSKPIFNIIQSTVLIILLIAGISDNVKKWKISPAEQQYFDFISYVRKNSAASNKFCFIHYNDKVENVRFINDAERDRLVSFKMVPEGDNAILEWYERILLRRKAENDTSLFPELAEKYTLNYLVSKKPVEAPENLLLVYQNPSYYLYKIQK